jgi:hypothetical protein
MPTLGVRLHEPVSRTSVAPDITLSASSMIM